MARITVVPSLLVVAVAGAMLGVAGTAMAEPEPVYRSVDADGEVSYSSEPPDSSVEVEELLFEPGPTEEEVNAARQRMQEQIEIAERLSQQRRLDEAARREQLEQRRYENPPYARQQNDDADTYFYPYPYGYGYRPGYPRPPPEPAPPIEPAPVTSSTPALLPKSRR